MTTLSTAINATASLATKAITITERIGLYEVRSISIVASATSDLPSGNYKLLLTYGGRTVALSALTASGNTLSGTLNLSTTQLEALFAVLPVDRLRVIANVWDATGKVQWARGGTDVWRNEYGEETAAPSAVQNSTEQGVADITNGATSVTVDLSALSITSGASIAGTVLLPSGATVGVSVIGVTFSTTSAVFQLSGAVPATGYKLSWMVVQ